MHVVVRDYSMLRRSARRLEIASLFLILACAGRSCEAPGAVLPLFKLHYAVAHSCYDIAVVSIRIQTWKDV
jgi:hypothetical protein